MQDMVNIRYIRKPSLGSLMASMVILWLNAGMYSFVQRYIPGIIMYGVFLLWFIYAVQHKHYRIEFTGCFIKMIPTICLLGLMYAINISSLTRSYLMFYVYVFMIAAIAIYYQHDSRGRSLLLKVWAFDVVAVVINTYIQVKRNPFVIRNMSANASVFESLFGGRLYGVASFSNVLCYSVVMLFLYSRIVNKKVKSRTIDWIGVCALLLLIFKSQIAILIAFSLTGILLISLASFFEDLNKLILFVVISLVAFAILYKYLPDILKYISTIESLPELLRVKASDASLIISGASNNLKDATVRMQQYENDIACFLRNPLVGTLGDNTNIGGHSTWIDFLGMYGLLSIVVMIWHIGLMKNVVKASAPEERIMVAVIAIVFTTIGIIDPIIFQNVYMVFLMVIPYMSYPKEEYQKLYCSGVADESN